MNPKLRQVVAPRSCQNHFLLTAHRLSLDIEPNISWVPTFLHTSKEMGKALLFPCSAGTTTDTPPLFLTMHLIFAISNVILEGGLPSAFEHTKVNT